MTIQNQGIIERISKLLSLSQSSNANEAANAASKAQELLLRHKLTPEIIAGYKKDEEIIDWINKPLYTGKRVITWSCSIASCLAKLNSCFLYTMGGNYILIGKESDREIVEYMFNSIVTQIKYLSDQFMKTDPAAKGKTSSNNFKIGAAETVVVRLNQTKKEVYQQYAGTTALVKLEQGIEAVNQWVKTNKTFKTKVPHNYRLDKSAKEQGREAGNKVSLNQGLNGDNKSTNYLS